MPFQFIDAHRALLLMVVGTCLVTTTTAQAPASGAYWAVYNATAAPAESSCLVSEGTSVDDACCTAAGIFTPHADLQGESTCFLLGPGLIPFSGCVGDGVSGYGENCDGGAGEPPFFAKDAAECGCGFVIEGSGCYKANDLPGQQWFVYLDGEACKEDMTKDEPTSNIAHLRLVVAGIALVVSMVLA